MKYIKKRTSITAYKAFDMSLKCRDFQYEVGKEYQCSDTVVVCNKGFHSCLNPLDCLTYYPLTDSRYCRVKIWGNIDEHKDDSKIASEFIEIVEELTVEEYTKLCADWNIKEAGYASKQAASGSYSKQAASDDASKQAASGSYSTQVASGSYSTQVASGSYSKQAEAGYASKQAASGSYSKQASSGYASKQAASGSYSTQVASGSYSTQVASGSYSKQAASGYVSNQVASGDYATQASSGYASKQAASGSYSTQVASGASSIIDFTGKNGVAAAIGPDSKIKSTKGSWITLSEYNKDGICVCVKSAQIDGKKLKAGVYYILKNKKFVEVC